MKLHLKTINSNQKCFLSERKKNSNVIWEGTEGSGLTEYVLIIYGQTFQISNWINFKYYLIES